MNRILTSLWQRSATYLAAALLCGTAASAQEDVLIPSAPIQYTVKPLVVAQPPSTANADVLVTLVAEVEEPSQKDNSEESYWLGVQVSPLPEIVKQQLDVKNGLAVGDVVADSPAAKAGIERHDILIKANDTLLTELSDLVKTVEASDGQEMTIALLRSGKMLTKKVTAAKSRVARVEVPLVRPEHVEKIRRVEELLKELRTEAGEKGLGMYIPRPAYVVPRIETNRLWQGLVEEKGGKADFPKDLSVRINKEGDQPAKIHVKKGDKEWNVSEDKLTDLPDDVRPHVEKMLGKGLPVRIRTSAAPAKSERTLRVGPDGKVEGEIHFGPVIAAPPVPPRPPVAAAAPVAPAAPRAVPEKSTRAFSYTTPRSALDDESKLNAILKKLEKLDGVEKELRDLRKDVDNIRKSKE